MEIDAETLRARRENMFLRLLFRISQSMTALTAERVNALGHSDLQLSFIRMLGNLDTEGTRIQSLARRLGTTRQAASQMAMEIEAKGLVERVPDPEDKRGVIIRFTPKGRKVLVDAVGVMTGIEGEYAAVVGAREFERMKKTMKLLLEHIDAMGRLGKD